LIPLIIPDLEQAKQNHDSFIESLRLRVARRDNGSFQENVSTRYGFGFGPWLYAYALVVHADAAGIVEIENLHTQIHVLAADVRLLLCRSEYTRAKVIFDEIEALNNSLDKQLEDIQHEIPEVSYSGSGLSSVESKADKEAMFEALIDSAPVAMMVMTGREHLISLANQRMIEMLGKEDAILGKPVRLVVPETALQPYLPMLDSVLENGQTYQANARPSLGDHYFDFTFKPLVDADGSVYGVMAMAVNVTEGVASEIAVEKIEQTLKQSELENKIKTIVLDYCELIIGISHLEPMPEPLYNNKYTLEKLGWQHNQGRTLIDAVYPDDREFVMGILPEIFAQKGGSYEIRLWNEVTKEPFWVQWNVMVIDDPTTGLPAILATVSPDITERKEQQILLQQQQQTLLNAIEVAQLGTWTLDVATQKMTLSPRHTDMFGIPVQVMKLKEVINHVVKDDRERLTKAYFDALNLDEDGEFEAEYTIIHGKTGNARIIHAKGQTTFNTLGMAVNISGIAQDVTLLRNQQQSLEALVELRTKELDASNRKLAAGNEKLRQANLLLSRSNEDLDHFAYVASHDLQEPLRKIQQFGSRLSNEYEKIAPSRAQDYIRRMSAAAERMSILIGDLLTFSRITTRNSSSEPVSLQLVVERVMTDLDLQISEAQAVVEVDNLPEVQGNTTHLGQLFQNLISNAVKFRKQNPEGTLIAPVIRISSRIIAYEDLPSSIRPSQATVLYHLIEVSDNGIGFDEIYMDRIFQVFQRLHGRSEYEGTGIGLAVCERVVNGMGGAITAKSQKGHGATFQIYIPQINND